jgi:CheY-like chemotaxis protein
MVVEDELLIGMDLVAMLEDWGYATSGPHQSPSQALRAIEEDAPDVAILDVNLGNGQTSMQVAQALDATDTPFAFLSGYEPSRYFKGDAVRHARHLRKPVSESALRDLVAEMTRSD